MFTRSVASSPKISKEATDSSPDTREASVSPVSSSASLLEGYAAGLTSDQDDGSHTSPPSPSLEMRYLASPLPSMDSLNRSTASRFRGDKQQPDHSDGQGPALHHPVQGEALPLRHPMRDNKNALGLGFEGAILSPNPDQTVTSPSTASIIMHVRSPSSSNLSSGLEEDDKAFKETKQIVSPP